MRSQQVYLTTEPQSFVFKSNNNRIFMVRNMDTSATIYVQYGEQPGLADDAWPVLPGEVYTLDPAAPADRIWVWATTTGINNRIQLG